MKIKLLLLYLFAALTVVGQSPGNNPGPISWTIRLQPGYNAIANFLDHGSNTLDEVMQFLTVPARLFKWDPSNGGFVSYANSNGTWAPAGGFLQPGEGAFLLVRSATSLVLTGTVHLPTIHAGVHPGLNFLACQTAGPCSFEEAVGVAPLPGDRVFFFDNVFSELSVNFSALASSVHVFGAQGWNVEPVFAADQGAMVFLTGAPRIVRQPDQVTAIQGSDVALSVEVMGALPIAYQWSMDGQPLTSQGAPTLRLPNVRPRDAGKYQLVAMNAFGAVTSAPIVLEIIVPPIILKDPESVTADRGETVTFTVVAGGTPPLHYQWQKNQEDIAGATNATLELVGVKPADAGIYTVGVSNLAGRAVAAAAQLAVRGPPIIVQPPVGQLAKLGDTVAFRVGGAGTPPLSYLWRLNGQNIAGATNASLVLSNLTPADAGAYQVVVYGPAGITISEVAYLQFGVPDLPFLDTFPGGLLSGASGIGQSSNVGATAEAGEPLHAGKIGGHSVWTTWTSPVGGILTISTAGSGFDTLLGVYAGSQVDALIDIGSDDDGGPYHTSRLLFNVSPDVRYRIAIDGLADGQGPILFGWSFEPTTERLPEILQQPRNVIAAAGDAVSFSVVVSGTPTDFNYQWLFEGVPIRGATSPSLTVDNVQEASLGVYSVLVGRLNRVVESRRARLALGSGPGQGPASVDKLIELRTPNAGAGAGPIQAASIAFGYVGQRVFVTTHSSTDPNEPFICGVPGGSSEWLEFTPLLNGTLFLNTEGSDFDTLLGVFTGSGNSYLDLTSVSCDNDSGTNGRTSRLSFAAAAGTTYSIVVDGVRGASGHVHLQHTFVLPLSLTNVLKTNSVQCVFRVLATPTVPFTVQRSSNMADWISVMTTQSPSGQYDFRDTGASASERRFYRALQNP